MRRLLGVLLALIVAVPAWPLAAGATGPPPAAGGPAGGGVGAQVLPAGTAQFAPENLVWAKGPRIHDGARVHRVAGYKIWWMLRTPYGFFLQLSKRYTGDPRLAYYDGQRLTWLREDASFPSVSPDGRLAGWIDHAGPRIRHGRAARVQVVDLVTGRRVFATSRWMGRDTDPHEEGGPSFLGFDERYAYWNRVVGEPLRMRTDLTTWETSVAATLTQGGLEIPLGLPYDTLSGRPVTLVDGRPSSDGLGGEIGFLAPDGRFAFNTSLTARLRITEPATGQRIDPDYGTRFRGFVGWQDSDTFFAALPKRFPWSYYLEVPDGARGWFAACDLPFGDCTRIRRFRDVHRIVFGWGGGWEAT